MKIKEIQEKLEKIKRVKISLNALGSAMGVSRQRIHQLLDNEATKEQIQNIEEYFKVDLTLCQEIPTEEQKKDIEIYEYFQWLKVALNLNNSEFKEFVLDIKNKKPPRILYDRARDGDEFSSKLLKGFLS